LKDKASQQAHDAAVARLLARMENESDVSVLSTLASGLGALKNKASHQVIEAAVAKLSARIESENGFPALLAWTVGLKDLPSQQTIDATIVKLLSQMEHETDTRKLAGLAQQFSLLSAKTDQPMTEAAVVNLMSRMEEEVDAFALSQLAFSFDSLMDKIDPATVQQFAAKLIKRIARESQPEALHALASLLDRLPAINLAERDISQISRVFEIPEAPCRVVLKSGVDLLSRQLMRQLMNPLCKEADWTELAEKAATMTGRPIVRRMDNNTLFIDFVQLSDYTSPERHFYDRYQITFPTIAVLGFLLIAAATLVWALIRSRGLQI